MPAVVPTPNVMSNAVSSRTRSSVIGPSSKRGSDTKIAMTTMLLSIGANAAAANLRCAFSSAVASAVNP